MHRCWGLSGWGGPGGGGAGGGEYSRGTWGAAVMQNAADTGMYTLLEVAITGRIWAQVAGSCCVADLVAGRQ